MVKASRRLVKEIAGVTNKKPMHSKSSEETQLSLPGLEHPDNCNVRALWSKSRSRKEPKSQTVRGEQLPLTNL